MKNPELKDVLRVCPHCLHNEMLEELMTEQQVADYLGLALVTLKTRRYYRTGPEFVSFVNNREFKGASGGRPQVRYRKSAVKAWLDAHTVKPRKRKP